MRELVGAVTQAMEANLTSLDWMTEATRKQALDKLHKVGTQIGNPKAWRDFSALKIKRDDALGNRFRAREFAFKAQLAKIGKPLDPDAWFEPPQVIDGFYSSSRNEILFTAGILQPPFVDTTLGDPVILGEVGRMIGHELIHGFDDEGRKFDGNGDLRDWWTPEDAKTYEQRAECFADEYSRFVAVEEVHVDGKLTLGENLADNGGLQLGLAALHRRAPATTEGPRPQFSDDQRFFLAFAQSQCANVSAKTQRQRATTDVHAPPRWRVNGSVQNMDSFEKAFSCKPGTPMAPVKRCRVW
jgi:endothelin-converting enzyme/putative endopeptidase